MPEEIKFGETSRYNSHPSGVECIEVAEDFNFNLGNVIKYVWRSRYGDEFSDPVLQLKKAEQYLHREIVRLYDELNADGPTIKTAEESAGSQEKYQALVDSRCPNGRVHTGHEWNAPNSGIVSWCRGNADSIGLDPGIYVQHTARGGNDD